MTLAEFKKKKKFWKEELDFCTQKLVDSHLYSPKRREENEHDYYVAITKYNKIKEIEEKALTEYLKNVTL